MTDTLDDLPAEVFQAVVGLLPRFAAYTLDVSTPTSRNLIRDWRKVKHQIEDSAWRPNQSRQWLHEIYQLPAFRNFNRVSKKRFRASKAGKAERKRENASQWARTKADPEALEKRRAKDRERYHKKQRDDPEYRSQLRERRCTPEHKQKQAEYDKQRWQGLSANSDRLSAFRELKREYDKQRHQTKKAERSAQAEQERRDLLWDCGVGVHDHLDVIELYEPSVGLVQLHLDPSDILVMNEWEAKQ